MASTNLVFKKLQTAGMPVDLVFGASTPLPPTGGIKAFNGTSWVDATVKRWDGSAWINAAVSVWDGTSWLVVS